MAFYLLYLVAMIFIGGFLGVRARSLVTGWWATGLLAAVVAMSGVEAGSAAGSALVVFLSGWLAGIVGFGLGVSERRKLQDPDQAPESTLADG